MKVLTIRGPLNVVAPTGFGAAPVPSLRDWFADVRDHSGADVETHNSRAVTVCCQESLVPDHVREALVENGFTVDDDSESVASASDVAIPSLPEPQADTIESSGEQNTEATAEPVAAPVAGEVVESPPPVQSPAAAPSETLPTEPVASDTADTQPASEPITPEPPTAEEPAAPVTEQQDVQELDSAAEPEPPAAPAPAPPVEVTAVAEPATPFGAPQNVRIESGTAVWSPVDEAKEYHLSYSLDGGTSWQPRVRGIVEPKFTPPAGSVPKQARLVFGVKAVRADGVESDWSANVTATV